MEFSEAVRLVSDQWITVHPNGKGTKGTPVEIDGQTGEILHGMGGKYNGKHISEAYKDIRKHEQGASAVIAKKHAHGSVSQVENKTNLSSEKKPSTNNLTKPNGNGSGNGAGSNQSANTTPKKMFGKKPYSSRDSMSAEELATDNSLAFTIKHPTMGNASIINTRLGHVTVSESTPMGARIVRGGVGRGDWLMLVPNDMSNKDISDAVDDFGSGNFENTYKNIGFKHEKNPESIAKVKRGSVMSHAEANSGHVNPKFGTKNEFGINCQTCVVAYEARRRGYNVQATGNKARTSISKNVNKILSMRTNLVWVDSGTGEPVKKENLSKKYNSTSVAHIARSLENDVKVGERYSVEWFWSFGGGHIVSMFKESDGVLRIYDPQVNKMVAEGSAEIAKYLYKGKDVSSLEITRVDNAEFNLNFCDNILKKGDK